MRWLLVCLIASGCAANFADGLDPDGSVEAKLGAAHGVEGEQVEYEMQLAGLTVGRFQIAVGNRGVIDGRPAVIVRSKATLAGAGTLLGNVDWDLTTTIDIDTGFAIAQEEEVIVDAPWHRGHETNQRTWTPDQHHHNAHSAAGALRGWFTAPGATDTTAITLLDHGMDVSITDAARENVGNTPSVRYDGVLRGTRPFSVWISDDTARVPLRMRLDSKVGTVEVSMVDYRVPRDP